MWTFGLCADTVKSKAVHKGSNVICVPQPQQALQRQHGEDAARRPLSVKDEAWKSKWETMQDDLADAVLEGIDDKHIKFIPSASSVKTGGSTSSSFQTIESTNLHSQKQPQAECTESVEDQIICEENSGAPLCWQCIRCTAANELGCDNCVGCGRLINSPIDEVSQDQPQQKDQPKSSVAPQYDQQMPYLHPVFEFPTFTASDQHYKIANKVDEAADVVGEINRRIEAEQQRRVAQRNSFEAQFASVRRIAATLDAGRPVGIVKQIPTIDALVGADLAGKKVCLQGGICRGHVAERKAECAICWEPLVEKPLGILADESGRRACPHFLHAQCAVQWSQSARKGRGTCPICRCTCSSVIMLPDFSEDAEAFFKALDVDGDGSLDRKEAMSTLQAILPVDRDGAWLAANFDSLWNQWDANRDGRISFDEFIQPEMGLLAYVRANCPSRGMTKPDAKIPSTTNTRQWFTYWDEDGNGILDENEAVRAIIRSLHLEWSLQEICAVRRYIEKFWRAQKGTSEISITLEDVEVGGFWEQLASAIKGQRCELQNPDNTNEKTGNDPPKSVGMSSKSPGSKFSGKKRKQQPRHRGRKKHASKKVVSAPRSSKVSQSKPPRKPKFKFNPKSKTKPKPKSKPTRVNEDGRPNLEDESRCLLDDGHCLPDDAPTGQRRHSEQINGHSLPTKFMDYLPRFAIGSIHRLLDTGPSDHQSIGSRFGRRHSK